MKKKFRFPFFWCIYAILVIAGVVVTNIAMDQITVVLTEYEASQPKHTAEKIFVENFRSFDANEYLERFDDSVFGRESRENVARYLSEKTEGKRFTYYSVSSDTEGVYKYNVKAGEVKIASFSIVEEHREGERFPTYAEGGFEVYFPFNEDITVTVPKGAVLMLNGNVVERDKIIVSDIPHEGNQFLPDGAEGRYFETYYVDGYVLKPEAEVTLDGSPLELFEGEEGYECMPLYDDGLEALYGEEALTAIKKYATYIQGRYSSGSISLGDVIKYFDPSSDLYKSIRLVANQYVQSFDSYEFRDEKVSEFVDWGSGVISCRVSFTQVLHRSGTPDYTDQIDYTLYLRRVNDKYLIYHMEHN